MKITVTPTDLIKRFVWDKYEYFCLDGKNTAEVNKIIDENVEFEISEEDAFVIGLTNVIFTSEVIYKFKQFLREILDNKNFEQDHRLYINRQILLDCIHDFKTKIPKRWVGDDMEFNNELAQLPAIYELFNAKVLLVAKLKTSIAFAGARGLE